VITSSISLPPNAVPGDEWVGTARVVVNEDGPDNVDLVLTAPGSVPDTDLSITPILRYAPDLVSVAFPDPALPSSTVPINVVANDRDGFGAPLTPLARENLLRDLRVDVVVGPSDIQLSFAKLVEQGALFTGEFQAPAEPGQYELLIAVTDLDGARTEERKLANVAVRQGVDCSFRCIIKRVVKEDDKEIVKETVTFEGDRKTTTTEMCATLCNRICFGPQGKGATHLQCSH
jgi:hypothetical protein